MGYVTLADHHLLPPGVASWFHGGWVTPGLGKWVTGYRNPLSPTPWRSRLFPDSCLPGEMTHARSQAMGFWRHPSSCLLA